MASRRPTQSNQQQQQATSSSWFLNSSTGLHYYYNAQTDEFIYQNGIRVPRPDSIPRAGLLEQHREAGSNNGQQMHLSNSPNGSNDGSNYTYAAGAQFDNRSPGGESSPTDPRNRRSNVQSAHDQDDDRDDAQEEDNNPEEESDQDNGRPNSKSKQSPSEAIPARNPSDLSISPSTKGIAGSKRLL